GSNEQKIGDFYASCMDTTAIDAAGTKPIEPELTQIAAVQTLADLQAETARLHSRGVGALFRFSSTQDAKDSTQEIAAAFQGGLGLPEREYYLKPDEKSAKLRDAYVKHVADMFALLGDPGDVSGGQAARGEENGDRTANRLDEEHGPPRSGQDLPQDDARGSEARDPELFLGRLFQGRWPSGIEGDQRWPAGIFQGPRRPARWHANRGLENLSPLALSDCSGPQ